MVVVRKLSLDFVGMGITNELLGPGMRNFGTEALHKEVAYSVLFASKQLQIWQQC
jgi:hypothetical protein